jgi:hypothetical protein
MAAKFTARVKKMRAAARRNTPEVRAAYAAGQEFCETLARGCTQVEYDAAKEKMLAANKAAGMSYRTTIAKPAAKGGR